MPVPSWLPYLSGVGYPNVWLDYVADNGYVDGATGNATTFFGQDANAVGNPSVNVPGYGLDPVNGAFTQNGLNCVCVGPAVLTAINNLLSTYGECVIVTGQFMFRNTVAGTPWLALYNAGHNSWPPKVIEPGASEIVPQYSNGNNLGVSQVDFVDPPLFVDTGIAAATGNAYQLANLISQTTMKMAANGSAVASGAAITPTPSLDVLELFIQYGPQDTGPFEGINSFYQWMAIFGPMDDAHLTTVSNAAMFPAFNPSPGKLLTANVPEANLIPTPIPCVPCCSTDMPMCGDLNR